MPIYVVRREYAAFSYTPVEAEDEDEAIDQVLSGEVTESDECDVDLSRPINIIATLEES